MIHFKFLLFDFCFLRYCTLYCTFQHLEGGYKDPPYFSLFFSLSSLSYMKYKSVDLKPPYREVEAHYMAS